MTKRTILVSLFGTVLGAGAILVLANPAAANQLLHGEYIVTQTTIVPAPAFIKFRTSKNGLITTQHLRCVLPNGLDSPSCFIQQFNLNLDVNLMQEGQYTGRVEVDYLPLEIWGDNHGFDVLSIEAEAPVIQKAEAYWSWWMQRWQCAISDDDVIFCNTMCGSADGTVTAKTQGVSNNPYLEPACELTCDCEDTESSADWTWTDAPEVLPG